MPMHALSPVAAAALPVKRIADDHRVSGYFVYIHQIAS